MGSNVPPKIASFKECSRSYSDRSRPGGGPAFAALSGAPILRRHEIMRFAGGTACATNGKSLACIGGACFSLPTPACGRIFSQLREWLLRRRTTVSRQKLASQRLVHPCELGGRSGTPGADCRPHGRKPPGAVQSGHLRSQVGIYYHSFRNGEALAY